MTTAYQNYIADIAQRATRGHYDWAHAAKICRDLLAAPATKMTTFELAAILEISSLQVHRLMHKDKLPMHQFIPEGFAHRHPTRRQIQTAYIYFDVAEVLEYCERNARDPHMQIER